MAEEAMAEEGMAEEEAFREATFRVFGCPPGTYGAGVAELPAMVCCHALRSGELVRLLPEWSNASRWVHALYPSRQHLSANVRTFLDFMTERLRPTPWLGDAPAGVTH